MSRIGKKPILIPDNVEVKIENSKVIVKGPRGEIEQAIPSELLVEKKGKEISISSKKKSKRTSALWGLVRSLLQNYVKGVSSGFEKKLEIIGVGYKAAFAPLDSKHLMEREGEKTLRLDVGFSHPVLLQIPDDLIISLEKNIISVAGADKQKVGEFAAKIRKVRPPEPYKGKGIRYLGEKVRKKEGKKAAATTA